MNEIPSTENFHITEKKVLIDLWSEGYAATGESSGAKYHGKFEATDLIDAARQYCNQTNQRLGFKTDGRPAIWGCGFFDNEADARKSFG